MLLLLNNPAPTKKKGTREGGREGERKRGRKGEGEREREYEQTHKKKNPVYNGWCILGMDPKHKFLVIII